MLMKLNIITIDNLVQPFAVVIVVVVSNSCISISSFVGSLVQFSVRCTHGRVSRCVIHNPGTITLFNVTLFAAIVYSELSESVCMPINVTYY